MYVIHENELVHVDTGSDVLEHYGVKGMKWGQRRALAKLKKLEYKKASFKEIAESRRRALKGSSKDINRARMKRAVVGALTSSLVTPPVAAAIGAATVTSRNLQRSANRFDRKADKMDLKIREQKSRLKSMGVKY